MKKRLFVAIPISEYLREIFAEYRVGYQAEGLRWTARENLHITVYFLGDTDENIIYNIVDKLEGIYSNISPFELVFDKISLAPPGRPPRMIWGVFFDKDGGFRRLVSMTFDALEKFAVHDQGNKESIAHLTLARFKDPKYARGINLVQPEIKEEVLGATSCDLMESELTRNGPIYKVVKTFSFGSRE